MAYPKDSFIAGDMRKGIDDFSSEISVEPMLSKDTVNVSTGIQQGVGPRYGMAPLPGHSDKETRAGAACNGVAGSEASSGSGLVNRVGIYGIAPLMMVPYDGAYPKNKQQAYLFLTGLKPSSTETLDASYGATVSSGIYKHSANLGAGLAESSYFQESPLQRRHKTERLPLPYTWPTATTPTSTDIAGILAKPAARYVPWTTISVAGKRVPYQWMGGGKVGTDPDGSNSPGVNLWTVTMDSAFGTATTTGVYLGTPSEFFDQNSTAGSARTVKMWCLGSTGNDLDITYTTAIRSTDVTAQAEYGSGAVYARKAATSKGGAGTSYSSVRAVLVNDPNGYMDTSYKATFVAGEKPLAIITKDWLKQANGMKPIWYDLTDPQIEPRLNPGSSLCFLNQMTEGAANSGVLEANATYEVGFAYYNKLLDVESNVVLGARITVVNANSSILTIRSVISSTYPTNYRLYTVASNGLTVFEYAPSSVNLFGLDARGQHLNDYELRFYYRRVGMQEWLPGAYIDAAKYWFYPFTTSSSSEAPAIGATPVAGPIGGRPGGFNDYSPLPKQRYNCVVTYKGRVFWFSEKSVHFSPVNQPLVYPLRNTIPAPSQGWRGGIVHIQPGETVQTSRLVMFGTDSSYVARFTGLRQQEQILISPDTVGTFDIDGSDMEIDDLCDATAYSYRAAVVAEGVLHWWGQQGVYRDDGMTFPSKVSGLEEPWIFDLVDTTKIDEVHCVYNKQTKEIVWFYPPKTPDEYATHGLIFNTITQEFFPAKWKGKVDWAQNLKIEKDDTQAGLAGERTIVATRETASSDAQRLYFFDHLCRSGDMAPKSDMVVKTVATPSTGKRRLTLATGFDATNLASIVQGDLIGIHRAPKYNTGFTAADDIIATVDAVGADYIDIIIPNGATWDTAASITDPKLFFPIWHKAAASAGLNGINYKWKSRYWCPGGLDYWATWLFLHLIFKVRKWASSSSQTLSLSYRTPVSGGVQSNSMTLTDNSDGHWQVWTHLKIGQRATQGQGLKLDLSGVHIGSEWVLQYLQAYANPSDADDLMEFEG